MFLLLFLTVSNLFCAEYFTVGNNVSLSASLGGGAGFSHLDPSSSLRGDATFNLAFFYHESSFWEIGLGASVSFDEELKSFHSFMKLPPYIRYAMGPSVVFYNSRDSFSFTVNPYLEIKNETIKGSGLFCDMALGVTLIPEFLLMCFENVGEAVFIGFPFVFRFSPSSLEVRGGVCLTMKVSRRFYDGRKGDFIW